MNFIVALRYDLDPPAAYYQRFPTRRTGFCGTDMSVKIILQVIAGVPDAANRLPHGEERARRASRTIGHPARLILRDAAKWPLLRMRTQAARAFNSPA
jgi:hypothetical protein